MPPRARRASAVPTTPSVSPPVLSAKRRPHLQVTAGIVAIAALGFAAHGLGIVPSKTLSKGNKPMPPIVQLPPGTKADDPAKGPIAGSAGCSATIEQLHTWDTAAENTHIAIGGSRAWQTFGEYRLSAIGDDLNLVRIYVSSSHPGRFFDEVAIASSGTIHGQGVLPAGVIGRTIDVGVPEWRVASGSSVTIQLLGHPTHVLSSAEAGTIYDAPLSGSAMNLNLASNVVIAPWNESYAGNDNVMMKCVHAGNDVMVPGMAPAGANYYLRKTALMLRELGAATTTMHSGDNDLYRWQASASSAGNASWKKIVFQFSRPAVASSVTTTISQLRLRRGSTDLPLADYDITSITGEDLMATSLPNGTQGIIVVNVHNEETVSESGTAYTLHGNVGRVGSVGDRLTLSGHVPTFPPSDVSTGFLTSADARGFYAGLPGPNIDRSWVPDGLAETGAPFVWSDLSEVPHRATVGTAGGSKDWIAASPNMLEEESIVR